MGMLVNGRWQNDELRSGAEGHFSRLKTVFRNWGDSRRTIVCKNALAKTSRFSLCVAKC